MSESESDVSPRSEDELNNYSPESFFPGDNEIFDDTTAWGSPEYKFWQYFFKIVSNSDDYHSKFCSRVKNSPDGKINWSFWINTTEQSYNDYETAIKLLTERVASGEFVFGRDYAKQLRQFVEEIITHRQSHLAKSPFTLRSHRDILPLWVKFQEVLAKVKTGPSITDWLIMIVIAAMGVYMYYLYWSVTSAE